MNDRLQILKKAGVIQQKTYEQMQRIDAEIFGESLLRDSREQSAMLVTHLAMAIERLHTGEIVTKMDDRIQSEVILHPDTEKNSRIIDRMEEVLGQPFPEEERCYLLMHLVAWKERERT